MFKFKSQLITPFLLLPRFYKNLLVFFIDLFFCILSVWISFYLRIGTFERISTPAYIAMLISILFALPIFKVFGLYRAIFRYSDLAALYGISNALFLYGLVYFSIITVFGVPNIPRTLGIIQPIVLFTLVITSRLLVKDLTRRNKKELDKSKNNNNAIIYGAGIAGRQLLSAMINSEKISIIGFIDDDERIQGLTINGIKIYSPIELKKLIKTKSVSQVYLAIPSASQKLRHSLINKIKLTGTEIRAIPSLDDLASGKVTTSELKELNTSDLLNRESVKPNKDLLEKNISNKTVLVTGAGGSIGSELCRQIIKLSPYKLVLVEMNEYSLYSIHSELEKQINNSLRNPNFEIIPLLANIQNEDRIKDIIKTVKPNTIFHAAAYKHVPLVERNLLEGIQNNIFGTFITAKIASEENVDNFVLISTDKAVRPTNVMGATKRVAELCLKAIQNNEDIGNKTIFSIVRFGNVLDSSGSVIPKFKKQIKEGGPITLTHPAITRFFMTIPEASQLVIQSSSLAKGGEVFLLDMGEPVKIFDLAKRMIELYGLSLKDQSNINGDIEIAITGLRPGEKLYEELLIEGDNNKTIHPKIRFSKDKSLDYSQLEKKLYDLKILIEKKDIVNIIILLKELVAGFNPEHETFDWIHNHKKLSLEN